ncbi:hypothetical protein [Colwellia sp. MEBiC06753]
MATHLNENVDMISLSYFFLFIIICHLGLMVKTFQLPTTRWQVWWLIALIFGVLYDNTMLLLSSIFGASENLALANSMRWLLHSIILPWLVIFAFATVQQVNDKLSNKFYLTSCFVISILAVGYGFYAEFILLELEPKVFSDANGLFQSFERFASVNSAPPWATILINFLVILLAVYLWVKTKWPWLFIGSISIFVVNGAFASSSYGFLLGNIMEVIFILTLIATEKFSQRQFQH